MLKFEAVLFDCDGVLVDSEPITNEALRGVGASTIFVDRAELPNLMDLIAG